MKFDADTASWVQKITEARRKLEEAAVSTRNFGEETAKTSSLMEAMGKVAGTVATSLLGVSLGFGAITAAAHAAFEEMNKDADAAKSRLLNLKEALAATGNLGQYGQIKSQLDPLATPTMTESSIEGIYAQISRAVPKATPAQAMSGIRAVLKAKRAGLGTEDATAVGINAAQLAKAAKPGGGLATSDEALAEGGFSMFKLGGMSQRDQAMLMESTDQAQALQLIMAGKTGEESSKRLAGIETYLDTHPGQKLDDLFAHPNVLPPNERALIGNVAAHIGGPPGSTLTAQLAENQKFVGGSPEMQNVLGEKKAKADQERLTEQRGAAALQTDKFYAEREAYLEKMGWTGGMMPFRKLVMFSDWLLGDYPYTSQKAGGDWPSGVPGMGQNRSGAGLGNSVSPDKIIEEARRQTALLQSINGKLQSNPALRNDQEGQK